jgi:hypothetical protein
MAHRETTLPVPIPVPGSFWPTHVYLPLCCQRRYKTADAQREGCTAMDHNYLQECDVILNISLTHWGQNNICCLLVTLSFFENSGSLCFTFVQWTQYECCVIKKVYIITDFQINHQPDATVFQFIILKFIYSSTCFGRYPVHHQEFSECSGSLWFYLRVVMLVVLCSWSGRL